MAATAVEWGSISVKISWICELRVIMGIMTGLLGCCSSSTLGSRANDYVKILATLGFWLHHSPCSLGCWTNNTFASRSLSPEYNIDIMTWHNTDTTWYLHNIIPISYHSDCISDYSFPMPDPFLLFSCYFLRLSYDFEIIPIAYHTDKTSYWCYIILISWDVLLSYSILSYNTDIIYWYLCTSQAGNIILMP